MKRLLLLLASLVVMASLVMSAAPNVYVAFSDIGGTTVDSQHSATLWDSLGAVPYDAGDTNTMVVCVTGTAVMSYKDVLYLGLSEDTALGGMELDTFRLQPRIDSRRGATRVPFCYRYMIIDTASAGGDGTGFKDTVYLYGAVGGSSNIEKVQLEDVHITVSINDFEVPE